MNIPFCGKNNDKMTETTIFITVIIMVNNGKFNNNDILKNPLKLCSKNKKWLYTVYGRTF